MAGMARYVDLNVRRDKTHVWDGVAELKLGRAVAPLDLSDSELVLTARAREGGDVVLEFSSDDADAIVIDPDQTEGGNRGMFTLRIDADDMVSEDTWPVDEARAYPYEIERIDGNGDPLTVFDGYVKYSPDVT